MPHLAANPAAFLHLSSCMVEQANKSLQKRNGDGGLRSAAGVFDSANVAAIVANFRSQSADENFAPACVFRFVSRLLLGHRVGAFHAPGGSSLFCFGFTALRVTVSLQILFAKYAEKISRDPP
jgi:hypothetical protein